MTGVPVEYDWLLPNSIKPKITGEGLQYFERSTKRGMVRMEVEDVLYFWPPDIGVEIGPAQNYPALAAVSAASVLRGASTFLKNYFDRGLVKATILTYQQPVTPDEAERIKTMWRRVVQGVQNAFSSLIMRGDFNPIVIGEGLGDLSDNNLTTEQREDISTALGVPQSKLFMPPGGLGDNVTPTDLAFFTDTVVPETVWIAEAWNKQIFEPARLSLVFTPQKMAIYQEDEVQRANAFAQYRSGGMTLEAALAVLGIHIPEGIDVEEEKPEPPPMLQPIMPQPVPVNEEEENEAAEKARFRRWAQRRVYPNPDDYKTDILSTAEKVAILDELGKSPRLQELDELLERAAEVIS